ncbi:hypothetical protein YPPY64_1764, partial [Yersinia pestis PY-64]
MIFH